MMNNSGRGRHTFEMAAAILTPLLGGLLPVLMTGGNTKTGEIAGGAFLALPGWVFCIAWMSLYALIGLTAYLYSVSCGRKRKKYIPKPDKAVYLTAYYEPAAHN